jgi:site-specific DNA recombinase
MDQEQDQHAIHRGRRHPSRDNSPPAQNENGPPDPHEQLRSRIDRVTLEGGAIRIALVRKDDEDGDANILTIGWVAPSPYRRREIIQGANAGSSSVRPLPTSARRVLIKALRKAHLWLDELLTTSEKTVESIAAQEGKSERSIRMTLSLAFLSPDIIKAAVEGRLPRGFGLARLIDLPTTPIAVSSGLMGRQRRKRSAE